MNAPNTRKKREEKKRQKPLKNDTPVEERILSVAAEIMNRKGFSESNISEIAAAAKIKDPIIYQYFKGKEDLLFAVVEDHMGKFLLYLDEQLQGISGAYNRLRKLIWAHLRYNDVNSEYITLVNLECRSNLKFYQTKAYELIRRYAGILIRILREGVEEGAFRSGINLFLVRDIIFGLVDFEAITCLITKEIKEATPDHEICMRLIERILVNKSKNAKSLETKNPVFFGRLLKRLQRKGTEMLLLQRLRKKLA